MTNEENMTSKKNMTCENKTVNKQSGITLIRSDCDFIFHPLYLKVEALPGNLLGIEPVTCHTTAANTKSIFTKNV